MEQDIAVCVQPEDEGCFALIRGLFMEVPSLRIGPYALSQEGCDHGFRARWSLSLAFSFRPVVHPVVEGGFQINVESEQERGGSLWAWRRKRESRGRKSFHNQVAHSR